jgi:hypothetical protein
MAVEYSLIVEGDIPPETIAGRAFPEPANLPAPEVLGQNTVWDLRDRFGFILQADTSENGYFAGESDGVRFSWEPARYTELYFRLDKFSDMARATDFIQTIVSRVLESGAEDAVVLQNQEIIVRRQAGKLTKYRSGVNWKV